MGTLSSLQIVVYEILLDVSYHINRLANTIDVNDSAIMLQINTAAFSVNTRHVLFEIIAESMLAVRVGHSEHPEQISDYIAEAPAACDVH